MRIAGERKREREGSFFLSFFLRPVARRDGVSLRGDRMRKLPRFCRNIRRRSEPTNDGDGDRKTSQQNSLTRSSFSFSFAESFFAFFPSSRLCSIQCTTLNSSPVNRARRLLEPLFEANLDVLLNKPRWTPLIRAEKGSDRGGSIWGVHCTYMYGTRQYILTRFVHTHACIGTLVCCVDFFGGEMWKKCPFSFLRKRATD